MKSILLGVLCALFLGTAQAASVTLEPVDARTAFDANKDGVFDSIISPDPTAGADFGNNTSRGLMEFDLSSILGNVTSAALMMYRGNYGTDGHPFDIEFHGYVGDGVLEPSDALVDNLITKIQNDADNPVSFSLDVSSLVQPLPDYAGFMIRLTDETTRSVWQRYFSTTSGAPGNLLVVNYSPIPIPSALYLFGSGLIGLVGVARRRQLS